MYEHWKRHWFFRLYFHVSYYVFQMLIDLRTQLEKLFCLLGTLFQLTDKNQNSLWTTRDRGRHDDFWDANRTPSKPEFQKFIYFQFWQSSLKNLLHVLIFANLKSRCNATKNLHLFHTSSLEALSSLFFNDLLIIGFVESWAFIKSVIS